MSVKGLKVLAGVLAALLAVWVLVNFFGGRTGGSTPEASDALTKIFQGLNPETVDEVRFRGPGAEAPVTLRRQEARWTVNGFPADSARVAGFWSALEEAKVGPLVASNPGNHPRLGVSADSTWTMELDVGGETRTLLVGDAGSRYGTVYVRHPGEDAVYLLEGPLRPEVTRTLDDWRNKRMARVDTARVWWVEVEREDERTILERADSLWTLDAAGVADRIKVRDLLMELASLDATGFFAPGDSLSPRGGAVTALDQAGDTLLFLELGSGEGERWARVRGDSIVYRIPSWRVGRLLPEEWR